MAANPPTYPRPQTPSSARSTPTPAAAADVGEQQREEVNKAKSNRFGTGAARGKNYGWADCEGTREFNDLISPQHETDIGITTQVASPPSVVRQ